MGLRLSHNVALLGILALGLISCSEPQSEEFFLFPDQCALDGSYRFCPDMSDSLSVYDLSLYSRIDQRSYGSFPVNIKVKSPSGVLIADDKVFWDMSEPVVKYRTGIVPSEYGKWEVWVYVEKINGLRGIGLICEKE